MKKFFVALLSAVTLAFGAGVVLAPAASAVDVLSPVCSSRPDAAVCHDNNTGGSNPIVGPDGILTTVTNWFSRILALVAVIVIMVSGFTMIHSGGDSNEASTARRNLTYAIAGLVVAAFAQTLVLFVLSKL